MNIWTNNHLINNIKLDIFHILFAYLTRCWLLRSLQRNSTSELNGDANLINWLIFCFPLQVFTLIVVVFCHLPCCWRVLQSSAYYYSRAQVRAMLYVTGISVSCRPVIWRDSYIRITIDTCGERNMNGEVTPARRRRRHTLKMGNCLYNPGNWKCH